MEISKSLFEDRRSQTNPFFINSARDIFNKTLQFFIRRSQEYPQEEQRLSSGKLVEHFNRATIETYRRLLSYYPDFHGALSYLGKDDFQQGLSIISEIQSMVFDYFIGPFASSDGKFSIRKTLREQRGRNIFIEYDLSVGSALGPMYRLLLDLALKEVLGRQESKGRVYLFIDEFSLFPPLEHIHNAINFGRGKGLRCFIGLQNINQLQGVYGEAMGNILASSMVNSIVFSSDASTRDFIVSKAGKMQKQESYLDLRSQVVTEKRMGNVLEDWNLRTLGLGEAYLFFGLGEPLRFRFPLYQQEDLLMGFLSDFGIELSNRKRSGLRNIKSCVIEQLWENNYDGNVLLSGGAEDVRSFLSYSFISQCIGLGIPALIIHSNPILFQYMNSDPDIVLPEQSNYCYDPFYDFSPSDIQEQMVELSQKYGGDGGGIVSRGMKAYFRIFSELKLELSFQALEEMIQLDLVMLRAKLTDDCGCPDQKALGLIAPIDVAAQNHLSDFFTRLKRDMRHFPLMQMRVGSEPLSLASIPNGQIKALAITLPIRTEDYFLDLLSIQLSQILSVQPLQLLIDSVVTKNERFMDWLTAARGHSLNICFSSPDAVADLKEERDFNRIYSASALRIILRHSNYNSCVTLANCLGRFRARRSEYATTRTGRFFGLSRAQTETMREEDKYILEPYELQKLPDASAIRSTGEVQKIQIIKQLCLSR